MKNLYIVVGVFFVFCINPQTSFARLIWEPVSVKKIINNNFFQLNDGRIIQPIGIDIPLFDDKRKNYQCIARKTTHILKNLFKNNGLYIRVDTQEKNKAPQFRHIKVDKTYLTEFLLRKGLGGWKPSSNKSFKSRFRKASQQAQSENIGIWSNCSTQSEKEDTPLIRKWERDLKKDIPQYFSSISVGRVKQVLSGDTILLENNIKVRLLGIQSPPPNDPRNGFGCFGRYAKKHLEYLILNKQVFLERDTTDINENRELLRYVQLPHHDKGQTETFINEQMILDGFAKSFWTNDANQKHKQSFEELQKEVYRNSKGAWKYCLQKIIP